MDDLPHPLEFPVDFHLGPREALVAQVDRVGQKRAAFLDALGVTAGFEFDALGLQKAAQVLVEFVFVNWFHKWSGLAHVKSQIQSCSAITDRGGFCSYRGP